MRLAVDASPIIHLASCDQLDLLPALAAEVAIPEAVLQELGLELIETRPPSG